MSARLATAAALLLIAACEPASSRQPPSPTRAPLSARATDLTSPARSPLPSPSTLIIPEQLAKVFGISADEAWAVTNRRVLHTTNRGRTWDDVTPAWAKEPGKAPEEVSRVGSSVFVLVSGPSRNIDLLRSKDEGQSWDRMGGFAGVGASLTSADSDHLWLTVSLGFAAGSEGIDLYRTADGGADWTKITSTEPLGSGTGLPSGCHKGQASFSSQTFGFMGMACAGGAPTVLKTTDGGRTWAPIVVMPLQGSAGFSAMAICFSAASAVAVVEAGHQYLVSTADGGIGWSVRSNIKDTGEPELLTPTVWLAKDQGELVVTHNAGSTWDSLGVAPPGEMHFVTENIGWAIMSVTGLEVASTTDGGRTWLRLALPPAAS